MNDLIPIKRALVSVSDKTGISDLAKILTYYNCEIVSTGGTQKVLQQNNIATTDISEVSNNPEAFGGRMKTISFNIESALLFDREKDKSEAASLGIAPIDLVVCNLYPFKKVWQSGAAFEDQIENIDIGGPTMIRAAAKNFAYVAVVTDPADYGWVADELQANSGSLSYETRKKLMVKAFDLTAGYDALVAMVMNKAIGKDTLRFAFEQGVALRYGENSHQQAKFYRLKDAMHSLFDMEVLHGKALSYNNILDAQAAIDAIAAAPSDSHSCAIIKHSNPCGFSEGNEQAIVLQKAWAGDPISAFGSIIAFNKKLEAQTARFFELDNTDKSKRKFIELIIAPSFSDEALTYLQHNKNLRILKYDVNSAKPSKEYRFLSASILEQDADNELYEKLSLVTDSPFDIDKEKTLIEFGLRAIKNIKSNAIAIVRNVDGYLQLLGMGAGQPNRLIATQLAIEKSLTNLKNEYTGQAVNFDEYCQQAMGACLLISDAFFPFADNVELAAEYGITKIVQPGGSIRDKHVVKACNDRNMHMIFTGMRHFKH